MQTLTIGQVARAANIGVETLRYYEREGLLPPPARSSNGYRRYPLDSVRRLGFIRHAKSLGFSLADIAELLNLYTDPAADSGAVKQLAQTRLADIDAKIAALQQMRAALAEVTHQCAGEATMRSECPILDALSGTDN